MRRVHYYETDAMKIAHHANYVKWMEEARTEFFREIGFNWCDFEKETGIMIPVLFQSVEYKNLLCFGEEFFIECELNKFNGVKMELHYTFRSVEDGRVNAIGITKHGFIDSSYKPIALQKEDQILYNKLSSYTKEKTINKPQETLYQKRKQ